MPFPEALYRANLNSNLMAQCQMLYRVYPHHHSNCVGWLSPQPTWLAWSFDISVIANVTTFKNCRQLPPRPYGY